MIVKAGEFAYYVVVSAKLVGVRLLAWLFAGRRARTRAKNSGGRLRPMEGRRIGGKAGAGPLAFPHLSDPASVELVLLFHGSKPEKRTKRKTKIAKFPRKH
jgi:hypothetical protein